MGRRSTVAALPKELVDACNGLIREGHTIDDILAALQGLGAQVSRSAVGRYVKGTRQTLEKYREAQEVAKVWVDKLEAEPNGDVARLLPEMLRTVAFQVLTSMGEAEQPAKAMDVMLLAKAIRDVAGTAKTHLETEKQLRAMRAELKAAARDVETQARQAGLSDDTVTQIKQRILGVGDRA
jgi:predicted transcriptional regulator